MKPDKQASGPSLLGLVFLAGVTYWIGSRLGSPYIAGQIAWLPALVWTGFAFVSFQIAMKGLEVLTILADWQSTRAVTGKDGTASWARVKDIKALRHKARTGPFWGLALDGKSAPLFVDFASNAMTVAPAGSGKGIFSVVPNAMSIEHGKILPDFKGELICMLKAPLEARGETVRVLNPGALWIDRIGPGDAYNPLDIIADDLTQAGGLRDVLDDLREMTTQILPEPGEKESDNSYFREGSRRLIADASLVETMVNEYDATFSSVALLIEDRQSLEDNARWIAGVDLEGTPHPDGPMPIERTEWAQRHDPHDVAEFAKLVRARAKNLIALMSGEDNRTFESFITGAQQALAPFAFGRLAPAMGRSTFRFRDVKTGSKPTTVFIVADASRPEAYKPFTGLMQWCAMTEIKRHPDKERPVYFILDEATNYKINGLDSLLTWGRSYGLRLHLIFQDLSAFERVYGKAALQTLLSETEIKQFLPGQRSQSTLELIVKLLGTQSVMAANLSRTAHQPGVQEGMSETGRPLMTEDEIRRAAFGLLFVRQAKPIAFDPISYAEIHPWRDQVEINPFHGKPFRKKIRLKV